MTIVFDVPQRIEDALRKEGRDPSQALKEAALVDFYRRREITQHELATALGISRLEADAVLKRHDIPLDLTIEELREQVETIRRDRER